MVAGDGLVGRITDVASTTAQVELITDPRNAVSAQVLPDGPQGIVEPVAGDPDDLRLDFISNEEAVEEGQILVTAGWVDGEIASAYPYGIPHRRDHRDHARRPGLPAGHRAPVRRHARPPVRPGPDGRPGTPGGERMIVTWQIGLRLAAILLLTVIVQVSFVSYLSILGATPDVVPVVIAVVGLLGGALAGAVAGFATGLLVDSVLLQTLGVSSLVLLSVGLPRGPLPRGVRNRQPAGPRAPGRRPDPARHGRRSSRCS